MGKQKVDTGRLLKEYKGWSPTPSTGVTFHRPLLKTPEQRIRDEAVAKSRLEANRKAEEATRQRIEAWIAKEREERERREAEYNKPLPDFPQKFPEALRSQIRQYVAKVIKDAAESNLEYVCKKKKEPVPVLGKIPLQAINIAIREAEMKPYRLLKKHMLLHVLWDVEQNMGDPYYLSRKVAYRLKNNFFTWFPSMRLQDSEFLILALSGTKASFEIYKKSGFKLHEDEERVTHLEIF